jgi:dihydrofolate reductase
MPGSRVPRSKSPRKIIVHIATSADGYIARRDDDMEWLVNRPAPKDFYGLPAFERSIDTKLARGRRAFSS